MRQHFRPYSLVLSSADITTAINADLKDSAGSALACNYISLTLSGDITSHVRMSANFPGLTTPQANFSSPADSINVTASGVPAVYTTGGGEAATLVLADGDRVSSVSIQGNEPEAIVAILTYGQVSVGSNMRDQDRPVGS
jgi:hypothetical protein